MQINLCHGAPITAPKFISGGGSYVTLHIPLEGTSDLQLVLSEESWDQIFEAWMERKRNLLLRELESMKAEQAHGY